MDNNVNRGSRAAGNRANATGKTHLGVFGAGGNPAPRPEVPREPGQISNPRTFEKARADHK
jgi:hypothetical protein